MGDISHKRFLFIRSISPGAFIENRKYCTQIGHINYTWCDTVDEVRIINLNSYSVFKLFRINMYI